MSDIADVTGAYNTFVDFCDIALMHCVSQYPARLDSLNLRAMDSMRKKFGVPVGFSDHTKKGVGSKLAVCAGAELLEFHITLDHGMEGPDHSFSLNPDQLNSVMTTVWELPRIFGDGIKRPHQSELAGGYASEKRRCCVAAMDIKLFEIITEDHIICLAPGSEDYVSAGKFYQLTNGFYEATEFIKKGTPIFKSSVKVI
jgi:sialic acid synthase SpsE